MPNNTAGQGPSNAPIHGPPHAKTSAGQGPQLDLRHPDPAHQAVHQIVNERPMPFIALYQNIMHMARASNLMFPSPREHELVKQWLDQGVVDALDPILMLHTSEATSMVAKPRPKPGSTGAAGSRPPMTATGPVDQKHITNYRQICLILIRDIMSQVAAYIDERPHAEPIEMDDERLRLRHKRNHANGEGTVVTATKTIAEIRLTRVIRRIGIVYSEHAMPHNDSLYRFAYLCETPEPEDGQFIIPSQAVRNAVQRSIGLLDAGQASHRPA